MSVLCHEGRYLAQITAQYFGKSPEKGTPSFNFGIRILKNLDQPEAPSEPLVRELTWWIAEKTSKWVLSDLQKLGYPGKTLVGLDPQTPGFHNFVGQEIEVFCAHENYKDIPRRCGFGARGSHRGQRRVGGGWVCVGWSPAGQPVRIARQTSTQLATQIRAPISKSTSPNASGRVAKTGKNGR